MKTDSITFLLHLIRIFHFLNLIGPNGYGESQPVAVNNTVEGREKNRRVDVAIFANKKLKRAAEKGELVLNK